MAVYSRNPDLEVRICEILGLDPKKTRSIDIHIGVGELTVTTIQRFIEEGELREITKVLEGCSWSEPLVDVTGFGEEWARMAPAHNGA